MRKLLEDIQDYLVGIEMVYGEEAPRLMSRMATAIHELRQAEAPQRDCSTCLRGDTLDGCLRCLRCAELNNYSEWEPKLTPEEAG